MKCPRCESKKISLLTKAPVDDAWEVYICETCTLSWRNTEGSNVTDPEKYDKRFKLNPAEFKELDQIPPIPELKK
ncbi:non-oxidative hydroxyarylic acid decarboxylases subunit D [Priestia megaterium]|jgi:protein-arginine kinase activator protein McsA|uniref:Vanillic acid non-oxidative decarboxylation protein n=1 Tax=Priestia megaterium TaxID=1404 RepID=A0AAE5P3D4_PRIMG|nr:non-oxidative hydroxyarylic acid decarboxylases subunit D [Priestia megaterium]RFB21765.1 vanillic acid non-oxidative decarboxylation protein [Bacillus sp. ALD]RFB34326.1 vanillic acid non-oxidative decarboxylation protein [Bacillus sp. RC]MCA4157079.1 vanillic acid non-oxidative decarboxylation protein [Priestia megaterium]MCR8866048.1 vanillic acid non-oxidative decarboxylation protein [Priestia megaterium]MDC7783586.1 non-oxidative hydroxyarylic acid decarboxylases subunit D [Priestia me